MGLTSTDRGRALRRLHARIRACTKCVDAGYLERSRPVVAGSIRDRIAIVGQAPGAVELTTGRPFSGRSGAELRRWLAEAGIDQDHLPYRTAITKCFPGKSPTGSGDRRPSPAEIALCAPWLDQELAHVRRAARGLDRHASGPTMRVPRRKKRGPYFHGRASEVRGREEVITKMPKKKKAAKKKH